MTTDANLVGFYEINRRVSLLKCQQKHIITFSAIEQKAHEVKENRKFIQCLLCPDQLKKMQTESRIHGELALYLIFAIKSYKLFLVRIPPRFYLACYKTQIVQMTIIVEIEIGYN